MAAVTVDRERHYVVGSRRLITATVDIAADADTYITKLKRVESFHATGSGGNTIDGTVSGGTITFNTTGAEADVLLTVIGY